MTAVAGDLRRREVPVPALSTLGTLLLGAAAAIDLGNAEPRAELAVGATGSLVFLVAAAFSGGADAKALAVRSLLFVGAGLSESLAVAAFRQATAHLAAGVPTLFLFWLSVLAVFLHVVAAVVVARESTVRRRSTRRQELSARLAGEEAERRRWAQDLHDDTLQELAAVQVLLSAASAGTDAAARAHAIEQARDCVARQISALRRLIGNLRPLALQTVGLVAAVEELARRRAQPGVVIEVHAEALPRLPAETETATYRIVQEAVTNAVRHAGASRITVEARTTPRTVLVTVRDNGRGSPRGANLPAGFGVLGMRERAQAIGAELTFSAHHGVVVSLAIPRCPQPPDPRDLMGPPETDTVTRTDYARRR